MKRSALVGMGFLAAALGCWTDPTPRERAACPGAEEAGVSSPSPAGIPAIDQQTHRREATATFALG